MRRAGCRGEVRWWRFMSRGVTSLRNRCGVMTIIAYLTLRLPSPRLRRHYCLSVLERKIEEEKATAQRTGGRGVLTAFFVVVDLRPMADDKHPRDEL